MKIAESRVCIEYYTTLYDAFGHFAVNLIYYAIIWYNIHRTKE